MIEQYVIKWQQDNLDVVLFTPSHYGGAQYRCTKY